jgi:hypothetical protein
MASMAHRSAVLSLTLAAASLVLLAMAGPTRGPQVVPAAIAATPKPAPVRVQPLPIVPIGGASTATGPAPWLRGFTSTAAFGPGDTLTLDGVNLGHGQGSVCIWWNRVVVENAFTADGRLCLTVDSWQDDLVTASVPADVAGVPSQPAQLVLVDNTGQTSNALPLSFVATLDVVQLYPGQAALTIGCSGADTDQCGPFGAYHGDSIFGNNGTDHYHLALANGWLFERLSYHPLTGSTSLEALPEGGTPSLDYAVDWSFGALADASYSTDIWLIGPKGVPLQ